MPPLPWDPFALLASEAAKLITNGWIALCLAVWGAALWVLRLALNLMDGLLTPDISETGPGAELYRFMFWLAGALALILILVQIGVAVFRRDGRSLGRAAVGVAQFLAVWVGFLAYAAMLVTAAGGLTRGLMEALLGVTTWRSWEPWPPFQPKDVTDGVLATVLLFLGLFLLLAAIGHFLVMIVRAASLLVLVATAPIAAAGLVGDVGRAWFWKTFRWFHAAALAPVLMVMVLGIGVKFAEGVAVGYADDLQGSVATAVGAVCLICVAVVSPVALYKLLSFVDPGTATGAAMRSGWSAIGGLQGLLRGGPGAGGSATASSADERGRSAGESSAEGATQQRLATQLAHPTGHPAAGASGGQQPGGQQAGGQQAGRQQAGAAASGAAASGASGGAGGLAAVLGPVGGAVATGVGLVAGLGAAGSAIGADLTNQQGVGHNAYYPDFQGGFGGGRRGEGHRANAEALGQSRAEAPPDPAPPQALQEPSALRPPSAFQPTPSRSDEPGFPGTQP